MPIDPYCVLCSQHEETINHLFFDCHYSRQIWESILNRFQIQRSAGKWDDELNWAMGFCKGKLL